VFGKLEKHSESATPPKEHYNIFQNNNVIFIFHIALQLNILEMLGQDLIFTILISFKIDCFFPKEICMEPTTKT